MVEFSNAKMKVKITDKEKIKQFIKAQQELGKKYNMYPIVEINLKTNQVEHCYYEADKLTEEEKRGLY